MTITISETTDQKYPSVREASYLKYPCSYCTERFYLVDPHNHNFAGGAIQREVLARHIHTHEISKVGRVQAICLRCSYDIMTRSPVRRE
jgi:hypothetical protein